ncbi:MULTISPECIES: 4Fe-4S binding protein [Flavobacteriaceae]|uniref:4Fe-4S binding protein n=1 Tax=Flavobacteriaceae TaxID=49546 RepID=UPI001C0EC914|nr:MULTISPECIES: 4Fe-4S binding protein [Allomuricauda]MDC6365124.1 4Fe-4S binding protein [Muricauda sp. AC10]
MGGLISSNKTNTSEVIQLMKNQQHIIVNGNQAVAHVAYRTNDVFPIYPITPSSEMSELVEEWSTLQIKNIFGNVPEVFEMQGEGGVAGAMHGLVQAGSLSTTFTASQGLLLMMPNMCKIAGELTPNVIHVPTRSVATHALSVFGDHSDIMAVRNTGYAFLGSSSVQEAMDFALIAQAATLSSRIPFVHFFDGFRTSHETSKIKEISNEVIKIMMSQDQIDLHRKRALDPNNPVIRGTSQGPDVFFQSREAVNSYYNDCPKLVQEQMDHFAQLTGRHYKLFDYVGHPEAEQVIIAMASATETLQKTISYLNTQGEKLGLIKVRLFRPFSMKHLLDSIPDSCKTIAVLDRTKEPGASGEPLYLDVFHAVMQSKRFKTKPKIVGGRYGLSSKEFSPAMVKAIVNNLKQKEPKNNFTVGINDDVTHLSLDVEPFQIPPEFHQAMFYTTKNDETLKCFQRILELMGSNSNNYVQGYVECDYKKTNSRSVAHLRVATASINAPYLISNADIIFCEDITFLQNENALNKLKYKGKVVLQSKLHPEVLWGKLSRKEQSLIQEKQLELYLTFSSPENLYEVNGVAISLLQACYFALRNTFLDYADIRSAKKNLQKVDTTEMILGNQIRLIEDTEFSKTLLGKLLAGKGNDVSVGELPLDGTYDTNTSHHNSFKTLLELPVWDTDLCTQCGACSMACPSGALRIKAYNDDVLAEAPQGFKSKLFGEDINGFSLLNYTIQVYPGHCTSCNNCVDVCPVKALTMTQSKISIEEEQMHWDYFETIPEFNRTKIDVFNVAQQQLQEPLFKYPMGEDGCGEEPYLKLLSQLFGDRMMVANATGASSIFGGALPTTPWSKNEEGRGPAWSNSLFEDNAEFGLGFRLAFDQQEKRARRLINLLKKDVGCELVEAILNSAQNTELEIQEQRARIMKLKAILNTIDKVEARQLAEMVDNLIKKSVWIVGGDGWAYDIGFGGLDHVLASDKNVNILVLDNEAYSNTGGQMSKATPYGATAKFAAQRKQKQKKDLGFWAMQYEGVYVASVAMGADKEQTLRALIEAEKHDGPSLVIAYCHSSSHGIDMRKPSQYHQAAVVSGQWLLYRNDPKRTKEGLVSLQMDSDAPSIPVESYFRMEKRFAQLIESNTKTFEEAIQTAQDAVDKRYAKYKGLSSAIPLEFI